jgi:two-component system LytT family sensor kinase
VRGRILKRCGIYAGLVAACSGFAILNVLGWFPARRFGGNYGPLWNQAVVWELVRWNLWIPLGVLLVRWHAIFYARRSSVIVGVLSYAAAAILAAALHSALLLAVYFPLMGGGLNGFLRHRSFVLLADFLSGIIVGGLVLGPAYARSSHLRASRLETQLAQAKLEALKMQLHPHFLFNTLNAISALEAEDSERAQRMLARLADFMRLTLDNSGVQEAALEREMDFLARYLEIERIRFPEKLTVRMDLSPETLDARVPNLILQPIVENAIRHGIAAQRGPGRIEISSRKQNGSLLLRVRDTGPGLRHEAVAEGIGLQNTRARLLQLYGATSRLTLENADGGGLAVTIEIPFATS